MFGHRQTKVIDKLAGIQVQTSLLGVAVAIGWGRGRVGCNLIDYVGFTARKTASSTSSGKGGSTPTQWYYTASVVMAICEGPITGIVGVYKDAAKYSGTLALSQAGLSVYLGTISQTPWPYLTSNYPTHALAYRTVAYAYAQDYGLGNSATLPNHGFEVDFAIQFNPSGGVYDANPKDILTDFLTNASYGVTNWISGLLGDWTDYSNYCLANNLLLSPVLDSETQASQFIQQVMDETNSDCFWSEGVLKIKPMGDKAATGNGVSWTPNLTPVFNFTDDDWSNGTEVLLEIVDQSDAYNDVSVEFKDRANEYQQGLATAYDLDNIVTYGRRRQDPQQFNHICDAGIAQKSAQLWLHQHLYVRDKYHFDLPMDYVALEPMDYVTLTTSTDSLELTEQLVRIYSIDEDAEGQDVLHVVAEGIGLTASAIDLGGISAAGNNPNINADPGSIATPFLFNAPQALAANGYEVWAAVAGTNANWGGCVVWASFDGTNYSVIGQLNGPSRYGVLSASLASHADPDTADTLSVDLTVSGASLASVSTTEADAGATLCWVDGELVSYATATLTATSKYNLTYLRRGQQGSAVGAHASGTNFVRLDGSVFKFDYLPQYVGQLIYLKFQSFNIYGRALQDISTCTAHTITAQPTGSSPYQSASGLGLSGGGSPWTSNTIHMVCNPVPLATSYRFDFYKSDGVTLCHSIKSASPECFFTGAQAALDPNGSQRAYNVSVTPQTTTGDGPTSSQVSITNVAPVAVASPSASGGATDASVTCTASTDPDLGGYVVFYSNTTGFNPRTSGSVVYSGDNTVAITGLPAGTYYCRIAAFDPWSSDPALLNLSSEMSFTITTGGGSSPTGSGGGGGGSTGSGSGGFIGTKTYSN